MQEKKMRSAPIDIALVKAMHLTWKMRVRSALNGISDWKDIHTDAPEKSDIGKWIQEFGVWKYQDEPIFEMFVKQHHLMHDIAHRIYQLAMSNRQEEARTLLSELDKASDDFLKLIDTYKTVLDAYKQPVS